MCPVLSNLAPAYVAVLPTRWNVYKYEQNLDTMSTLHFIARLASLADCNFIYEFKCSVRYWVTLGAGLLIRELWRAQRTAAQTDGKVAGSASCAVAAYLRAIRGSAERVMARSHSTVRVASSERSAVPRRSRRKRAVRRRSTMGMPGRTARRQHTIGQRTPARWRVTGSVFRRTCS